MRSHTSRIISIALTVIVLITMALSAAYAKEAPSVQGEYGEERNSVQSICPEDGSKSPEVPGAESGNGNESEPGDPTVPVAGSENVLEMEIIEEEDAAQDLADTQQTELMQPEDEQTQQSEQPSQQSEQSEGSGQMQEPDQPGQQARSEQSEQQQSGSTEQPIETGQPEKPEESPQAAQPQQEADLKEMVSVAFQLLSEGGALQIKTGEGDYELQINDSILQVLSPSSVSSQLFTAEQTENELILHAPLGTSARLVLRAEEGWEIGSLHLDRRDGTDEKEEAAGGGEYQYFFEFDGNLSGLRASFRETKEEDPYAVEGYDPEQLAGLDFSSMRLIVGTWDPSIFVDESVIISQLNGLYLLQFTDPEVAGKAYLYYSQRADLVEIDGKVMAVNGDGQDGGEPYAGDLMTEDDNPFAQAAMAAGNSRGSYDVAIIDTGTNGYAAAAVSVIGDNPGDENGHGTRMASLIAEQNPGASILSIKAFEGSGLADLSAIYAAFQYALSQNVRIISISASAISASGTSLLSEAIAGALGSGVLVVASAGNNGRDAGWYIPAGMSGVLTIGACDAQGIRLGSSNYGDCVDYNVTADSTSEAAARFTGWLSAHSLDQIPDVLGQGMIFSTSHISENSAEGSRDPDSILEAFRSLLETGTTKDGILEFVRSLTVSQAQDLYTMLSEADLSVILGCFYEDVAGMEFTDALEAAQEQIRKIFHTDQWILDTTPGSGAHAAASPLDLPSLNFGDYPRYDPVTGESWYQVAISWGISTGSGTFAAFCAEAYSDGPSYTVVVPTQKLSNDVRTMIYLVSPAGPLYGRYNFDTLLGELKESGFGPSATEGYKDYVLCHCMISGLYCGEWGPWYQDHITALQNCVQDIRSAFASHSDWMQIYNRSSSYLAHYDVYEGTSIDVQDLYWVEVENTGNVSFAKSLSNAAGSLTVRKTLTGSEGSDQEFTFTLTVNGAAGAGYAYSGSRSGTTSGSGQFTLRAGQSVTITGLPAGASYKVIESDVRTAAGHSRFRTTVTSAGGSSGQGREVSGTIASSSASRAFSFTVSGLTGTHPYTVYSGTSAVRSGSVANNGAISLSAGQNVVISQIPEGSVVQVTETLPSDSSGTWSTNQSGNKISATVTGGQTRDMGTFRNTFTPGTQSVGFNNEVQVGFLSLRKATQSQDVIRGNALYALDGAVYEVYSSAQLDAAHKVCTLTTKADGTTDQVEVLTGTYYVIETRPSKGHAVDPAASAPNYRTVTVTRSNTTSNPAVIPSTEPVLFSPLVVTIDKDGGDYAYKFPLAGVRFQLTYYDNLEGNTSGEPLRTWIMETREGAPGTYRAELEQEWMASGSDPLYQIDGRAVMPLGTYKLQELSTVPGYTLSRGYLWPVSDPDNRVDTETGSLTFLVRDQNGTVSVSAGNAMASYNRPVRLDTEALGSTAGNDVNETHYMDASVNFGVISDSIRFDNLTEGASYRLTGRLYDVTAEGKTLYGSVQDVFTAKTQDEETFEMYLPVYRLKDLIGHTLVVGETLEQSMPEGMVKVAEETDLSQTKQAVHVIAIRTILTDEETEDHAAREGQITVKDQVICQGLLPGDTFTLKGELLDQLTRRVLARAETTFIAGQEDDTVTMEFPFAALPDHTYVVYEKLYYDGHLITSHQDPEDEEQIVHVPQIRTSLKDPEDEGSDTMAFESMVLQDTVHYKNLIPGEIYTVSGVLMDQSTGEPALDDEGQEIRAETAFTPESPEGDTVVEFRFSGVSLAGRSVTAFETLTHKGITLTVHADLEDEAQTVRIPKIFTTLADPADGGHDALASEEIVLTDQVDYQNLVPGREYRVSGVLMDPETGEPVMDDQDREIRSAASFIPQEPDGAAFVTFRFPGISLAGRDVVAFEEVYAGEKLVAVHAQLDAPPQTLSFPEIRTTLSDVPEGEKDVLAEAGSGEDADGMELKDTVTFRNLMPGEVYVLEGLLMDKKTGEAALDDQGQEIRAETEFTAPERDGSQEVLFRFHGASLAGHTLVAVEELYHKDKLVAVHSDLDSFDQSAWIPGLTTTLYQDPDQDKEAEASVDITLRDEVLYHNLLPGKEYRIFGRLVDKDTGKAVMDDREEIVTAEAVFMPEQAEGSVLLTFRFSGVNLTGKSLVAFEELYRRNRKVAVHSDIHADEQTVRIPGLSTCLKDPADAQPDELAGKAMTLTDTVAVRGLVPGRTYTIRGLLMDRETKAPAKDDAGQEIRGEVTFTAEQEWAEQTVTFAFQGEKLKGHTLVAFEDLYRDGKHLAGHQDLEARSQTVWIPDIRTTLKNVTKEGTEDFRHGWIVLEDEVHYRNLIPGKTYRLSGTLYRKDTGDMAADDRGEPVTAEAEFIPDQADGSVTVTFRFRGFCLEKQEVTAFEQLFRDGKKVAVHEDLQDKAQSVTLPRMPKPPVPPGVPRTSDISGTQGFLILAGSAALIIAGFGIFLLRRRKKC